MYFGNGEDAVLEEGSCGAVVWTTEDENGDGDWNVIGQFHERGKDVCYCPTYSRMASLGLYSF